MLALSAVTGVQSDAHLTLLALVLGFVIGTAGHLLRSRALILIGILMIAVASAYFAFGPGGVDLATIAAPG